MAQFESITNMFLAVWPIIFWLDFSRYMVAAGVMALVLLVFARQLDGRRIQEHRAVAADRRREFTYSLSTIVSFSLTGFAVYWGSQYGIFRIYGGELPGGWRTAIEILAMVLCHDAYFYWAHRTMHRPLLFRRVHRVHHKSRTPTPWAAYAFAPTEAVIEAAFLPLSTLFIPVHELTVLVFVTHMIFRNVVGHAGFELFPSWWLRVPVLRWITTTTHHDLHHSHGGYNFGLYFTWWDRAMRTEHPEYHHRFSQAVQSTGRNDPASPENAK